MADIAHQIERDDEGVSISFAHDQPDIDWMITVTLDNRIAADADDEMLVTMAHDVLVTFQLIQASK